MVLVKLGFHKLYQPKTYLIRNYISLSSPAEKLCGGGTKRCGEPDQCRLRGEPGVLGRGARV